MIAAAVTSDELQGAVALSLCVDALKGDVSVLQGAVSRLPSLKQICFLRKPDRSSDVATARLGSQLFQASRDWWSHDRILQLGCAFSSSLRRTTWLPPLVSPPVHAFPVSHLYVRWLPCNHNTAAEDCCYDALIDTERFAVGLVSYLESDGTEKLLLKFVCGPPSLSTYTSASSSSSSSSTSARFALNPSPTISFAPAARSPVIARPGDQVICHI